MAILKCLNISQNKTGNPAAGLNRCLKYITNPDKTEGQILTGGSCGGDAELSYREMVYNKKMWNQTEGRQGEHFVISFPKDEKVDKETACRFAEDFCSEFLHGEYIHAWAVHVDRDHTHIHLAWDHVNINSGLKQHFGKYSWLAELQPLVDRICRKYGLRTLDFDPLNHSERQNKYHPEWESEKEDIFKAKKNVSWTDIIRADIDTAIAKSKSWDMFLQTLREMHYEIKDGRHLSLRPEGKERFVRSGRLGPEYTKDMLLERLSQPRKLGRAFGDAEPILKALRDFFQKTGQHEVTGIKVIYYQRWYAYSYVNRSKVAYRYRKDLAELGRYTDRCAYLFRHDILSEADLQKHLQELDNQRTFLKKELTRTQNQIYNTPLSGWRKIERLRAELELASEVEKPAIQRQITALIEPLRNRDMMADSEQYRSLQDKKHDLQIQQKKLNAEIKMTKDLVADFGNMKSPDDIMQDPDRFIPEPFTDKSYQRITVNKFLFRNVPEESDYYKFKIPGNDENILIYKEDTRISDDDSYASCYLYDHLDYKIIDHDNNYICSIPGKDAMTMFSNRTREKAR